MKYDIQVIPQVKQRYDTVGDYWKKKGTVAIRISDSRNDDYHFMILVHELIEEYLTRKRGIPEESITSFDKTFEYFRLAGKLKCGCTEPGLCIYAPYKDEHLFADAVERLVCHELGIAWQKYEKECEVGQ